MSEFTKKLRGFIKLYEKEVPRRAEITFLEEACDIIEKLQAEQPTAGEWTKEIRDYIADFIYAEQHGVSMQHKPRCLEKDLIEACDRLDTEIKKNCETERYPIGSMSAMRKEISHLEAKLDRAEAINKDLLEACGPFARLADMIPAPDASDPQWVKFNTAIRALPLDRYRETRAVIARAKKEG